MVFYTPGITGNQHILNEEESIHAVRVLRLKKGDAVTLVDGRGGWYTAELADPAPKSCRVKVTGVCREYGKRPYRLHIALAPTKNTDRFEWFVEKSVEIGIDEITPLLCEHSERKHINMERIQRIMTAAMKQSKKAYLPQLNAMAAFDEWLKNGTAGQRLIAYCGEGGRQPLKRIYQPGRDVSIAIGPEGDFSPEEVSRALASGFHGISLGESRLRTETAGIVACHSIFFMNGQDV
jgi:16S rRNA (uracil1498-N3)-methyltransferase